AILNVTPDSFSDGGRLPTLESAIAAGLAAAACGAAVVDVGGESTRPRGSTYGAGAGDVSSDEELRRVVPVIAGLRAASSSLPISVDTRKAEVAEAALAAGADIVNVVTGLEPEPRLLEFVARRRAAIILNHCRGTPSSTFEVSRFDDVVAEVARDLALASRRAQAAGISARQILLDPGLGFGKKAEQNIALLLGLARLASTEAPLTIGASRKAFLTSTGGRTGRTIPPEERLPESLAAAALAANHGREHAVLLRVHDVDETVRFLRILALA
ncbi:MAG: dihydropteroate synthase, partial [Thermoanaerobaculia bacterium]